MHKLRYVAGIILLSISATDGMPDELLEDCSSFPHGSYWTSAPYDRQKSSPQKTLLGTKEAQNVIWRHQFPVNCAAQKFLVVSAESGLSAIWHLLSGYLALAMALDRVMILDKHRDEGVPELWMQGPFCEGKTNFDDCFFERWSSCTLDDAKKDPTQVAAASVDTMNDNTMKTLTARFTAEWTNTTTYHVHGVFWASVVPPQLQHLLDKQPRKHWVGWMASQFMAFLVRPNARTRDEIQARRMQWARVKPAAGEMSVRSIPQNYSSVFIRRGSKYLENVPMTTVEAYVQGIETLRKESREGVVISPDVYLMTEDKDVFDEFTALYTGGSVYWLSFPFYKVDYEGEGMKGLYDHMNDVGGWAEECVNVLAMFDAAMGSETLQCRVGSNLCRTARELQATVRCRADINLFDPTRQIVYNQTLY